MKMITLKETLNKFVGDHENELFSKQLRELLESQVMDYLKKYTDRDKYPLEAMEIELNRHIEVSIDPNHGHVFNVDITIPAPSHYEVKFTTTRNFPI